MKTYKPATGKGFVFGIMLLIFLGLIFCVPLGINLFSAKPNPAFLSIMGFTFVFVMGMLGYFSWSSKTMEYILDDEQLIIKWAFNKKIVPINSIRGIQRTVGTSSTKVMGASWPGFHIGAFTDPLGHGTVNLFATRLWGDIVLIKTKWEVIGLTPEDTEQFLEDLNCKLPDFESDFVAGDNPEKPFSPWKDKVVVGLLLASALVFVGAGLYLYKAMPTLPAKVPMHYNFAGEVDRYGSPKEVFTPLGIGIFIEILMIALTSSIARNNKSSAYMMGYVGLFLSLLFSLISIGMVLSA